MLTRIWLNNHCLEQQIFYSCSCHAIYFNVWAVVFELLYLVSENSILIVRKIQPFHVQLFISSTNVYFTLIENTAQRNKRILQQRFLFGHLTLNSCRELFRLHIPPKSSCCIITIVGNMRRCEYARKTIKPRSLLYIV